MLTALLVLAYWDLKTDLMELRFEGRSQQAAQNTNTETAGGARAAIAGGYAAHDPDYPSFDVLAVGMPVSDAQVVTGGPPMEGI